MEEESPSLSNGDKASHSTSQRSTPPNKLKQVFHRLFGRTRQQNSKEQKDSLEKTSSSNSLQDTDVETTDTSFDSVHFEQPPTHIEEQQQPEKSAEGTSTAEVSDSIANTKLHDAQKISMNQKAEEWSKTASSVFNEYNLNDSIEVSNLEKIVQQELLNSTPYFIRTSIIEKFIRTAIGQIAKNKQFLDKKEFEMVFENIQLELKKVVEEEVEKEKIVENVKQLIQERQHMPPHNGLTPEKGQQGGENLQQEEYERNTKIRQLELARNQQLEQEKQALQQQCKDLVDHHEEEMKNVQQQLNSSQFQVVSLQDKFNSLVSLHEQEKKRLQQKAEQTQLQTSLLEQEIKNGEYKVNSLNDQLQAMTKEKETVDGQIKELQQTIQSLQVNKANLSNSLSSVEANANKMQLEMSQIAQEHAKTLNYMENEKKSLENEKANLSSANMNLAQEISKLQYNYSQIEDEKKNLDDQLKREKQSFLQFKSEKEQIELQLKEKISENKNYQTRLKQLEDQKKGFSDESQKKRDLSTQLKKLEQEKQILSKKLDTSTLRNNQMSKQLDLTQEEKTRAESLAREKEQYYNELKQVVQKLDQEKNGIEEFCNSLTEKYNKLQVEHNSAIAQLTGLKEIIEALEVDKSSLLEKTAQREVSIRDLEQTNKKLKSTLDESHQQQSSIAHDLAAVSNKLQAIQRSLNISQQQVVDLEKKCETLVSQHDQEKHILQMQLNQSLGHSNVLEEEKKQLCDRITTLQQTLEKRDIESKQLVNQSQEHHEHSRKKLLQTQEEVENLKRQLQHEEKTIESTRSTLDSSITLLKSENHELQSKYSQLQEEKIKVEHRIQEQGQQISQMKHVLRLLQQEKDEFETVKATLDQEKMRLATESQRKQATIDGLSKKIEELERKRSNQTDSIKQLTTEKEQLIVQLEQHKKDFEQLQEVTMEKRVTVEKYAQQLNKNTPETRLHIEEELTKRQEEDSRTLKIDNNFTPPLQPDYCQQTAGHTSNHHFPAIQWFVGFTTAIIFMTRK